VPVDDPPAVCYLVLELVQELPCFHQPLHHLSGDSGFALPCRRRRRSSAIPRSSLDGIRAPSPDPRR
jgi:hypothetical protein